MPPGNRQDWSGLLYLPGEELVRSTIDGDDADWSESLSYVPPDGLVRTVLDASQRERPVVHLPATLKPHRAPRGVLNRARWTAAVLAGLGLSPFSLAAAATIHLVFWLVVGPWILTQAKAARSIRIARPSAIVATRLIYVLPARGNTARNAPSRKPRTAEQFVDSTNSAGTAFTRLPIDSTSRPTRPAPGSGVEREVTNALNQELIFARDGFDLERDDIPKLELIVRVLASWPELRLRVLGAAPRPREGDSLPGMAEAEAIKRALVQSGIAAERIEIGQMPEAERRCPEREPNCAAARRRVRTMVSAAGEHEVNRPPK